jgi:hypothetical protein
MLWRAISMTIYNSKRTPSYIYRKIYEQHYGKIPVDIDGRTYEVHHIDGDHSNNDPSNLIAVTIKDHYEIHYAHGDWQACLVMSERMKISPQEKTDLARKSSLKRVEDGTHHWIGDNNPVYEQLANGTHNFAGGEIQRRSNREKVANGTHHLLGGEQQRKANADRIKARTHNFLHPEKVTCPHCGLTSIKNGNMTRWHGDNCKLSPLRS